MKEDQKNILLVEDDELFVDSVKHFLDEKYNIWVAESAEDANQVLAQKIPDVLLLDITLPEMNGLEFLKKFIASGIHAPVIMVTADGDLPKVVEAVKLGAFDYLTKPMMMEELLVAVERALTSSEMRQELEQRRNLQLATNREYQLIGVSTAMEKLRQQIEIVGKADSNVLILGETGTGKELVARQIHASSSRASGPFVAINCGAIPKDLIEAELFGYSKGAFTGAQKDEGGKFLLAHRGTLVLDEIGELPTYAQTKLLRVLEEKEFYPVGGTELKKVDVRVIAATNRNLEEMLKEGMLREDLYYRLNVCALRIPPLRNRKEDILPLCDYFLEKFNRKFCKNFNGVHTRAKHILLRQPWKGNVRELRNFIERIVLFEDDTMIREHHIGIGGSTIMEDSNSTFPQEGLDIELQKKEKELLEKALQITRGNRTKAAKLLKISAPAFYYRLEKYGLT